MAWTELGIGKHAGLSLPQVAIRDPDWFFWAMEQGVFDGNPALLAEAKDVAKKARRIRVRDRVGKKMVVHHYVHPPTGSYSHSAIVPVDEPVHEGASHTVRHAVFDLSFPRQLRPYDKTGNKNFVATVKEHYFGNRSARLSKQRCEEFFDTDSNFDL